MKAKRKTSKRVTTKQTAKVTKKVSRFKREARRTARKMKSQGILGSKRKEKDPALSVPNSWPGKEQILQTAALEREVALQDKKAKKEAAKKLREWEKANPDKAKIKKARAEARALQLEEARKESLKASQSFSTQMHKVIPRCNCIIQVLDARCAAGSISPAIESLIEETQKDPKAKELVVIYLINKIDLVPRNYAETSVASLKASLKDNAALKIKRKVAVYSTKFTESPGMLMKLMQTDWLKNVYKKKIIAAVVGFPNTGKNSLIRDLEVTAKTVSVHAASQVPRNSASKIPGAQDLALVTFPRDSTVESRAADGFNVIFKQNEAVQARDVGEKVAMHCIQNAAVKTATFYKIAKVSTPEALLSSICKKRGLVIEGAQDTNRACAMLAQDISSGKLLIASALPSVEKKTRTESVAELLDVLKQCVLPDSKLIEAPEKCFEIVDFVLNKEVTKKERRAEKKAAQKAGMEVDSDSEEEFEEIEEEEEDPTTYKLDDSQWVDEGSSGEEFEEMEEDEE